MLPEILSRLPLVPLKLHGPKCMHRRAQLSTSDPSAAEFVPGPANI
jgi:hypothetical protein